MRYKAEIAFVSPHSNRHSFTGNTSCFLGVSLENENFTTARLRGIVQWISRRFPKCLVLVGDSIHRITLESSRPTFWPSPLEEALRLGDQFIEESTLVMEAFRDSTEFTFLRCSEVQQWDSYDTYHRRIRDYFDKDAAFRESVEAFGRGYQSRRSDDLNEADQDHLVRRSCDYFLEEFAVFACLKRLGYSVMVYPGSFSTLTEIARGDHKGAPEELRDLIVVSLNLRGRG